MKKLLTLIFAFCVSTAAFASSPTPESIEKLLKLMQAEKTLDAMRPVIDNMMKSSMEKATQGQTISADEQKILDNYREKALSIMHNELTMEKLKPMYVDIYSKNFTQEDINGLIAFYESPAGKAYVEKMPVVVQSIMADMPKRLDSMMQEMQKATEEMKKELADLKKKQEK